MLASPSAAGPVPKIDIAARDVAQGGERNAGQVKGPEFERAVRDVEAYLNRHATMSARFVQIGPQGGLTRGRFYLSRPGRLRFDYDPPTPILLVADGFWLVLYDRELKYANRWPVSRTPLGVLVDEKVDLRKRSKILGVERKAGFLRITLADLDEPDQGSITLSFSTPAMELRHWKVIDAQGGETNISLSELRHDLELDPKLFIFHEPSQIDGPDAER